MTRGGVKVKRELCNIVETIDTKLVAVCRGFVEFGLLMAIGLLANHMLCVRHLQA